MVVWKSAGRKGAGCRPTPQRGQTGHGVEQTQDSPVKGLDRRVHEAGGEGPLGCNQTSGAGKALFQEPEWNQDFFI